MARYGSAEASDALKTRRWTFVFQRRWLAYFAGAIIFAIACVLLSNWQQDRGEQAHAANLLVSRNFYSTPVPLEQVLPTTRAWDAGQEWRRVTVTGEYLSDEQYLVRNRATDSGAGLEVLTPFRLEDGTVFVVDRGWVASPNTGIVPKKVPSPPAGLVTATVRLQPGEPTIPGQKVAGDTIGTINLPTLAKLVGGQVFTGAYGLLDSQTPAPAQHIQKVIATPPVADTGLHWSYMIQWLIFAAIGFFGLGYAVRTEYRKRNEDDPEFAARDAEREARRLARRARTDAGIEDQLLDASSR